MSNIPSAKLQIASTRYGQSAHAQNRQFGEVSLESDGRVDDTFRSDKDVYHLSDVADFIEKQHALAQQSLQSARETFETGEGFDQYGAGDKHRQIVRNLAEESGIEGSAYPKTDWRGVVTETNVNLEGSDGRYNGQSLKIENGAEGTTAHLQTRNGDALHTITVPVGEDGKVHLEASSESAEFSTPWLSSRVAGDIGSKGVKSLDDARLPRLAEAASGGFHLPPTEMGDGWKVSTDGSKQTWSTYQQNIVIDSSDHSFSINAVGTFTGHAGSGDDVGTDYTVENNLKWSDGRFQRVE